MSLPAARARGAWSLRAWLRAAVSPVRALQPTVTTWSWSNVAALPPPPRPEAIFAMADAVIARVDDDIARAVERAINHTAPRWTHVRVRHDPCFVTVSAKCRRCGAIFSTAWARGLVAAALMDARDACADAYGGAIARIATASHVSPTVADQLWLWPTAADDYAWQGPVEDPAAKERRLRRRAADEVTAEDRIDYELWKVGLDPVRVLHLLMPRGRRR